MELGEHSEIWLDLYTPEGKEVKIKFSSVDIIHQFTTNRAYVYVGTHLFEVMITNELARLFHLK